MSLNHNILEKYKNYLVSLDYPLIKMTNEKQIQKIFDQQNRIFLITWIIEKLGFANQSRIEKAKKTNKTETVLAEILYENGFIKNSEKYIIIFNSINVETEKQIIIFDRIFYTLSFIHSDINKENISDNLINILTDPSQDKFKDTVLCEENLFPQFGETVKMTNEEKNVIIDELKSEIQKLEIDIKNINFDVNINLENVMNDNTTIENDLFNKLTKAVTEFNSNNFTNNVSKNTNTFNTDYFTNVNFESANKILKVMEKKYAANKILKMRNIEAKSISNENDDHSLFVNKNYEISTTILTDS